jgi:hypothetical protein
MGMPMPVMGTPIMSTPIMGTTVLVLPLSPPACSCLAGRHALAPGPALASARPRETEGISYASARFLCLVRECRVCWSLARPPHPIDVGSIAQMIGYDGTPLSDSDFLAYAARYQAAGKPVVSAAPISASNSTVFAKQTNTGGFISKMAVCDGKVIKIVNDKGDLWKSPSSIRPEDVAFSYISVPVGYELTEATFVINMPDKVNTLLCKFIKPGTFDQPSVLVIFAFSR